VYEKNVGNKNVSNRNKLKPAPLLGKSTRLISGLSTHSHVRNAAAEALRIFGSD
jgi:hypothetical protein